MRQLNYSNKSGSKKIDPLPFPTDVDPDRIRGEAKGEAKGDFGSTAVTQETINPNLIYLQALKPNKYAPIVKFSPAELKDSEFWRGPEDSW